ncbi:carbonic anhydrase [Planctomicrobium sp. SH527]|uniref:carbonic anhydrase n=1 Tax=Planctomicrobium sp. SH527 TaxID=3448123 RepID=UPI003F5AE082
MNKLVQGIQQFQSKVFTQQEEMFRELSKGQAPPALVITCSDSRICPNLLTQSQPGELFVLRTAGNIVPAYGAVQGGEAATVEYAVAALKVQDVIICGHSHCGAMKALLNPESLNQYPSVKSYLHHAEATRRIVEEHFSDEVCEELRLQHTIEQNVLVQMHNLRTHPSVAAALKAGQLRLHGWVYTIETGAITAFSEEESRFMALQEHAAFAEAIA